MLRKRKETSKDIDLDPNQGKQVNATSKGKADQHDLTSRLNLITGLIFITLLTCILNLNLTKKLESDGWIELAGLASLIPAAMNETSNESLTGTIETHKPKVWVAGKNMESGYLTHVVESFQRIGYELVDGLQQEWDILWSHDYPFGKEFFSSLKPHQRVNHFPGSGYITNKVSLATSSMKHIPKAFHLPKDKDNFVDYAKKNPDRMWVKKSNNHRGIRIEKLDEMNLDDTGNFVQEYIQNPLLIDGKKFDVGLYVILTSIDPLRVYIYDKDALLRFCGNKYLPFNESDFNSYVVGDSYTPIWEMPSLSKYFTDLNYNMKQTLNLYLKSIGKDPEAMWLRMEEAIATVYKEKEPAMSRLSSMTYPTNRNFFEMVRFDFLVDEDLNVYLMEANMSPNLSSLHFAPNKLLYEQVIYNLFSLVGITRLDGLQDWPRYEAYQWDLRVSDKDISTNEALCTSDECFLSCRSPKCKSCFMCLSEKSKLVLKDAYLEHNYRWNSKRLIPSTSDDTLNPSSPSNDVQVDWFRGKCLTNKEWCT